MTDSGHFQVEFKRDYSLYLQKESCRLAGDKHTDSETLETVDEKEEITEHMSWPGATRLTNLLLKLTKSNWQQKRKANLRKTNL